MQYIVTAEVILVLIIIVAVIGLDVYFLAADDTPGSFPSGLTSDTFSAITRYWSKMTPIMPWVWGLMAGRFFHWGQAPIISDPSWLSFLVMIGITAILLLVTILLRRVIWQPISSIFGMTLAFVLAYVVGALFWPVNVEGIFFI